MKGVFNGYSPTGRPKYYKFRTSSIARKKRALSDPVWEEEANIQTPSVERQVLLEALQETHASYNRLLRNL
jgi:hypothetical protein